MGNLLLVGSGRVWTIKWRAGPSREPLYHGQGMAGSPDWGQGDVTKIEQPSDTQYNQWDEIASFQASPDRPTLTLSVYEHSGRSDIMELIRIRCPFDIQVHMGLCEDPRDFDHGWQKVRVLEDASATGYSATDHGALEGGSQDKITEEMPTSARWIYDVLQMRYQSVAANEVGEEVIAVDVCDRITCGDCEGVDPSDGCLKVFAVTNSAGSSPGLLPQVIITTDQFGTNDIIERWVTTFTLGDNASDAACVGSNFVVITSDGEEIHYAPTADMIDEDETWTQVTTGIVAGAGPNAIWNYSPLFSFIAGLGGYIYLMKNPSDGLTVLDAASIVTDDLNDIEGWDAENVAAVGDAGAFVYSQDGTNFEAGTAPVGPTDLYALAYRNKSEIWVGGDDGILYVTTDYGAHWTTKALPGAGTQVDKILWLTESVGFVAVRTAAPLGIILRTINGGYTWYIVPEGANQAVPVADGFNDMAGCEKEANRLFIGGLGGDAADGILLKAFDS